MSALLEVRNVTKKFGGLTANNDVSFAVEDNEILSVIGPNGAGKSTFVQNDFVVSSGHQWRSSLSR
jgi:ABC-type branched-subunit amino acid transport system ATPase component